MRVLWPQGGQVKRAWPRALPKMERQRHVPSACTEIEPQAVTAADLQQPPREFRVGWGALRSGSLTGQVCRQLDVIRNRFYGLDPCISFCLEKHQMPSWWHQILVTNRKPLVKGGLHGAELPFPQSLTQWPSPTAALEQSLRAVSDAASRAAVLILPQIKLNSRKEKKTMTTHQLTFFSSSLNLVTDTEGATLCLPDIKLLRQKMQPHCPRPAPSNKSAELHHLMSRMKQVCRWDKQWKIPPCGTGSLFLY